MNLSFRAITASRVLLATFFAIAGVLHFVLTPAYIRIMPSWLPWHYELVVVSGLCEIAGGAGVLWPRMRHLAGCGLLLLCVAVLPANLQMLLNYHQAGAPAWQQALLLLRLPLQLVLMGWIWSATRRPA